MHSPPKMPLCAPDALNIFLNFALSCNVNGGRAPSTMPEEGPAIGSEETGEMFSSTARGPAAAMSAMNTSSWGILTSLDQSFSHHSAFLCIPNQPQGNPDALSIQQAVLAVHTRDFPYSSECIGGEVGRAEYSSRSLRIDLPGAVGIACSEHPLYKRGFLRRCLILGNDSKSFDL